ncbi:MAG: YerC/YecD family TrpR-related protein [bacterium]|nr:YerC/YecD family TrpR-related protein [bacterium]
MKNMNDEYAELLYDAVLQLKTPDECRRFFDDLCTISELRSMSQRMEVAMMLYNKRVYTDIAEKTGASTATISRVNKCLNYGTDGYNIVLKRLKSKEKSDDKL